MMEEKRILAYCEMFPGGGGRSCDVPVYNLYVSLLLQCIQMEDHMCGGWEKGGNTL